MDVAYWIENYGYLALLLGAFFEGESFVIAAGFAAHQGHLYLPWVIIISFLGSAAGDQFYFALGRRRGRLFLAKKTSWQPRIEKVHLFLSRYRTSAIFLFRFMYGLRSITPFVLGLGDVKGSRFLLLDSLAAIIWSTLVSVAGYAFGAILKATLANVKHFEKEVIFSILGIGGLLWFLLFLKKRFKNGP